MKNGYCSPLSYRRKRMADGGDVDSSVNASAGNVASSVIGELPGTDAMNGLQYTKALASTGTMLWPGYGTAIGAGVGAVADIASTIIGNDKKAQAFHEGQQRGEQRLEQRSVYAGGGFGQVDPNAMPGYKDGGGIHIKPSHRGRFTAYKKRTGQTTEEALHSDDPHVRQMANFARNAKKWHHKADGGEVGGGDEPSGIEGQYYIDEAFALGYAPDEHGHMPSRNYQTDHVLKTPAHRTFPMAIQEDRRLGYTPMVGPDGKVYTVSPNDIPSKGPFAPERANGGEVTTSQGKDRLPYMPPAPNLVDTLVTPYHIAPRVRPIRYELPTVPNMQRAHEQLQAQRGMANGGTVGHVIPAENVPEAKQDARQAGRTQLLGKAKMKGNTQGGVIPGNGNPKADDKTFQPKGGEPIRISSGEMYVPDDDFEAMAAANGMSKDEYAAMMYPNAVKNPMLRRAYGGPVDGGPPYNFMDQVNQERASGPWDPDQMGMQAPFGQPAGGTGSPAGKTPTGGASAGNYAAQMLATMAEAPGSTENQPTPMAGISGRDIMASARTPQAPMQPKSATQTNPPAGLGEVPGFSSIDYDELKKQNALASTAQGALQLGSLLYNAFSRRSAAPRPGEFVPEKLDLQTGALEAKLDQGRARGTATALYNTRGQQNLGRNMGIIANDLSARLDNAAQVEQVENQERSVNNQLTNNARVFNINARNAYNMSEENSENQFRSMKGQAISNNLSALAGITSSYMNNQNMLFLTEDRNKYNADLLRWLEGHPDMANVYLDQLLRTQ